MLIMVESGPLACLVHSLIMYVTSSCCLSVERREQPDEDVGSVIGHLCLAAPRSGAVPVQG